MLILSNPEPNLIKLELRLKEHNPSVDSGCDVHM